MIAYLFADATRDAATNGFTTFDLTRYVGIPAASAIIAGLVSWWVSSRAARTQRRISLDSVQNKLLELAIQYPHLERDDYCESWPPPKPEGQEAIEKWQDDLNRYETYCCYVFNMISQNWLLANKKAKNLEDILSIKEYVQRHYCWWEKDESNIHFYETDFCTFIDDMIRDLRKEKKITKGKAT